MHSLVKLEEVEVIAITFSQKDKKEKENLLSLLIPWLDVTECDLSVAQVINVV